MFRCFDLVKDASDILHFIGSIVCCSLATGRTHININTNFLDTKCKEIYWYVVSCGAANKSSTQTNISENAISINCDFS